MRLVIRCRFLDPDSCPEVIAQKIRQQRHAISQRSVERIIADYGLQKKLYALNPANPPQFVQAQRTRKKQRSMPADPKSLERQVRQMLADKISGNQVGIWLLLPDHLRLGTWDLMRSWTGAPTEHVEPRLALHLVNEAALCLCFCRQRRTLSQKGFELANGLPFVPTDPAIHDLLDGHTLQDAQQTQIALGKLRRAGGHFTGTLLALDPHRMTSYSQRQMRRHRFSSQEKPAKMAQTFFLLDCHTNQPVCFNLSSSAQSVVQASPALLDMATQILGALPAAADKPLILADKEHYCQELFSRNSSPGCAKPTCSICCGLRRLTPTRSNAGAKCPPLISSSIGLATQRPLSRIISRSNLRPSITNTFSAAAAARRTTITKAFCAPPSARKSPP